MILAHAFWMAAMYQVTHRLVLRFQDATGAPKESQEHKLNLLQARVASNRLQHPCLDLLGVVRPLTEDMLQ